MARTSARIDRVDTPIIPTVAALVREHPGTISLGQGVVNYGPPAQAMAELPGLLADPLMHRYQAVTGIAPLVEALGRRLADTHGVALDDSEIMVTAGSNSAFLNAIIALADAGDEIILPLPWYFNHEMAIRMAGCIPVSVPTLPDWQLDIEAIAQAITPRTRAIVTVSPNNPTGAVYSAADLRAVNALAAHHGLWHFSDEAYAAFVHEGEPHFASASIPGAADHTVSFHSFSKHFGMASWRVGYMVYPRRIAQAMHKVQDTNLICAPVASQLLALAALRHEHDINARIADLARVRLAVYSALEQGLGELATFPRTRGAFYVLMRLPGVTDALEFNRTMVRRHRVATIPGFAFGLVDTARANYQRLSFGALDAATVARGVERFIEAVRDGYSASHPAS